MSRSTRAWLAAGCVAICAATVRADDPWELGAGDDSSATSNLLRHAETQTGHDLQGAGVAPDQDWTTFVAKNRHSYEARVSGIAWDSGCGSPPCPLFDRVTSAGAVLTAGAALDGDIDRGATSVGRTVRWIANLDATEFLRAMGDQLLTLGPEPYDVVLYDTTLFLPRWNNSGSQSTVLILQNTTGVAVQGYVYFHDDAGTLLRSLQFLVPEHAVDVIATAGLPELAGHSGSALIAHLGGYEALAGKGVALEPATGFTFDTPITSVPR
jgi:hypothetical protein